MTAQPSRITDHESPPYDVVIVGGGLVGSSLALALQPLGLRVALVETALPPATAPAWDERCIAINDASHRIFRALGVWEALAAEAAPITSTHISERGRFGVARFSAQDADLDALGYNVPLRALGRTLWDALARTDTTLCCPDSVTGIDVGEDHASLKLASGETLDARLVVAADGAQSPLRRLLGVGARTDDYGQSAIVTAVRPAREPRGCAYERFTEDGPIALLPKPGGRCSLVWTLPTEAAQQALGWSDAEFLARAQETFGERLGPFLELGRRSAYPLSRVMSDTLSVPRVLFVGNAAQSLHPVAAQGFNLGLRDAACVAQALEGGGDPGTSDKLRAYEQLRVRDRDTVSGFTDRLVRLFSNRVPGLRGLRHLGLLALDLAPPLKQAMLWQNLGYSGATPRLARGRA